MKYDPSRSFHTISLSWPACSRIAGGTMCIVPVSACRWNRIGRNSCPIGNWKLIRSQTKQQNNFSDDKSGRTTGAVKHQQSTSKIREVQPLGASATAPAVSATSCMGISSSFRTRLFSSLFGVQHCQTASRMTTNRNLAAIALAGKRARNSISSILCTDVQGMTRLLLLHIFVVGLLWNLICSNVWHCHGKWSCKLVFLQLQ